MYAVPTWGPLAELMREVYAERLSVVMLWGGVVWCGVEGEGGGEGEINTGIMCKRFTVWMSVHMRLVCYYALPLISSFVIFVL